MGNVMTWKTLAALIGIGLLVLPQRGSDVPRGIRNNNPGNIRKSGSDWLGKIDNGTDAAFEQFSHPVYGIRALARTLSNYQRIHGLNTVREIINRWAPPVENKTGAYIEHVASVLGVRPDEHIDVTAHLVPLVTTIIRHENGVQPYSRSLIEQGVALA